MRVLFYIIACCVLASCSSDKTETAIEKNKVDSSYTVEADHLKVKEQKDLTDAKGIVGIFFVPEMLTITRVDSARMSQAAASMAKGYSLAAEDIERMKVQRFGSMGAIYYNNDTSNFIFECVVPIDRMPDIKPKHTQVVVLEEGKMIIYNHYGSYQDLFTAYSEIKAFCQKYKLEQAGPMREFYITDATMVPDTNQWLTRIMLPIK